MVSMYLFFISGRYVWGWRFHQNLIHHCCLIFCICGFSRILVPIQEYILPCQWAGTPTLHTVDQVCPIFPGRFRGDRSTPADYFVNTRHLYLPQGFIHFCSCVWTNECEAVGYSSIAAGAKKIYSKMCGAKYWGRVAEEGVHGLEGPNFGAWAQVPDPRIQECLRQLPFSNQKTRRTQILPFVPTVDTHILPINVPLPHMAPQISKRKCRGFYASG